MDHLLILGRNGFIILKKLRIDQHRCQIIVEFMRNVARHHSQRLDPLVMPDLVVFLDQHLHSVIDLFQIRDLLLLGFRQKTVSQKEHCDHHKDQDIRYHNPDHHRHHAFQWPRKFLERKCGINDPSFSLDRDRLKCDDTSDFF